VTPVAPVRRISVAAALIAVGVALGFLLAGVPNVEAISAVSFFAGYQLGAGGGVLVGALAIGIFSMLNPLGPPLPHVLAAQIVGMGIIGAAGHLWALLAIRPHGARSSLIHVRKPFEIKIRPAEALAAALGALLTLLYSVLVDYGFAVSIGRWKDPVPVIAVGLPFSAIHVISNGLIFAGLGAFLVRRRNRMAGE